MEPSDHARPEDQPDPVDLQLNFLASDIKHATDELSEVIESARERADRLDRLWRKPSTG